MAVTSDQVLCLHPADSVESILLSFTPQLGKEHMGSSRHKSTPYHTLQGSDLLADVHNEAISQLSPVLANSKRRRSMPANDPGNATGSRL